MRIPPTLLRAAATQVASTLASGSIVPVVSVVSVVSMVSMVAALLTLSPSAARAQVIRFPPPLELRVPKPPSVLSADGGHALVYELHVTNFSPAPIALRRLEILGDADGRVLHTLEDSALSRALARPGLALPPVGEARASIGGGLRAVAFLWVPVTGQAPARLRHRLTVRQGSGDSATTQLVEGVVTDVASDVAVVGAPLRGGPWLAANGPAALSGHRRALIPTGDAPTIAQRFAIDYVKLDSAMKTHAGDPARNENYYAHGQDALAVADGIVVFTKDSIPENVPGVNSRAVPITLETVGGNFVILDIGGGRFAFYAHLIPGSLRVKKGDRVTRGQLVGIVGNSGNSTEPHLHFHISDSPSPLGSEGVPYVHDRFDLVGRCRFMFAGCAMSAAEGRTREMPLGNLIVRFPQ